MIQRDPVHAFGVESLSLGGVRNQPVRRADVLQHVEVEMRYMIEPARLVGFCAARLACDCSFGFRRILPWPAWRFAAQREILYVQPCEPDIAQLTVAHFLKLAYG